MLGCEALKGPVTIEPRKEVFPLTIEFSPLCYCIPSILFFTGTHFIKNMLNTIVLNKSLAFVFELFVFIWICFKCCFRVSVSEGYEISAVSLLLASLPGDEVKMHGISPYSLLIRSCASNPRRSVIISRFTEYHMDGCLTVPLPLV